MSLFWNKNIEPGRVIYTRTKGQRRTAYLLMLLGFLLMFGVPTLIINITFSTELLKQWAILVAASIAFLGLILIAFLVIFFNIMYFRITFAKRKNKKVQITSTNEGDTIVIEN
jgi:hypothetical protein